MRGENDSNPRYIPRPSKDGAFSKKLNIIAPFRIQRDKKLVLLLTTKKFDFFIFLCYIQFTNNGKTTTSGRR